MPHGCSATRDPHRGPTQGTHTGDPHRGDSYRGPTQGTQTGDPHRGEGPTEDPPPEGRATQGTHTEHTQTAFTRYSFTSRLLCKKQPSVHPAHLPAFPTLVQYYCTIIRQYTTPLPTSRVYALHHTILVITISCKGQCAL